jgi:large subunit ribosomal protein L10
MNRTEKEAFVEELRGEFEAAKSVILTSYQNLEVNTINELRAKFRQENVEYHIVKNTLARLAAKGTDKEALIDMFSGPIAIAYSREDAVSPAKIVDDFAKENKEKFVVRGGILEGELLDEAGVKRLADMPTKDELRVMLLQTMTAGPIQLLRTLSAGPQEFVMLLEAKRQKDEEA